MKALRKKLGKMAKLLMDCQIITANIAHQQPFTAEKKRKLLSILKGPIYSPTRKKLAQLTDLTSEITDLANTEGDSRFSKSIIEEVKSSWEGSKRKRDVYLANLIKHLSVNGEYVAKIRDGKADELDIDQVDALHKKIVAYHKIIVDTKKILP
jgi:hypothetical protein